MPISDLDRLVVVSMPLHQCRRRSPTVLRRCLMTVTCLRTLMHCDRLNYDMLGVTRFPGHSLSAVEWQRGCQQRRIFSSEFKADAVRRCDEAGRTLTQVAGELNVHPSLLQTWRRKSKALAAGSARTPTLQRRLMRGSPSTASRKRRAARRRELKAVCRT